VSLGGPALLSFDDEPPAMEKGVSFNLYNNVWGTNFPMWYEEDARFRFILRFEPPDRAETLDDPTRKALQL
jgi:hypothetical protein